ncbi:hypothetical protein IDH18_02770 [Pelagibacterales bacterium SAG-MED41]|nr:hypothetical protein [Pelagibacterales bacterium SAG-MED41]
MKPNYQNRSFGLLFSIVFFILALWPLINKGELNIFLISIALIFLTLGILNSKLLSPLNKIWIKFGEILGKIIAPIVMAIVYFLVLTPISLFVRLFGKDLIGKNFNASKKTYWIKRKNFLMRMDKQF